MTACHELLLGTARDSRPGAIPLWEPFLELQHPPRLQYSCGGVKSILGAGEVVSHTTSGMAGEEHPRQGFRESVAAVHDARKVLHDDVLGLSPFLNGEMLNLDVTCSGSRSRLIDHGQGSLVVDVHR